MIPITLFVICFNTYSSEGCFRLDQSITDHYFTYRTLSLLASRQIDNQAEIALKKERFLQTLAFSYRVNVSSIVFQHWDWQGAFNEKKNFRIDAMLQVFSKAFARSIRQTKHPRLLGRFNRYWDNAKNHGWILCHKAR